MNHGILILFAIPILCIIVIGLTQVRDEVFKKKFVIERRRNRDDKSGYLRRYSDSKEAKETLSGSQDSSV